MSRVIFVAAIAAGLLAATLPVPTDGTPSAAARVNAATAFAKLPIGFEPNVGQAPSSARFVARLGSSAVSLGPTGVALARGAGKPVELTFLGSNRQAAARGARRLPGAVNYLVGADPRGWRKHVPTYERVRFASVYPGIDVVYRSSRGQLEYDLVVAPGADPANVRLGVTGATKLALGDSGELQIGNALVQSKPVSYQRVGGVRKMVASSYVLGSDGTVRLRLGGYDRGLPLVIDPVLGYSTFLGSNHNDTPFGIAADAAGSAYITGTTNSNTFPGVGPGSVQPTPPIVFPAGFNGFVTKLNPQGTAVVYSTYLSGDGTSNSGQSIAVDGSGNAIVVGSTNSTTFPGTSASSAQPMGGGGIDGFVTKLNATGDAIVFSTFLGGSSSDAAAGVAVDGSGAIYVTGSTGSPTFPGVTAGSLVPSNTTSGFLTKLSGAGALVYSMFMGGTDVAVDGAGAAYVTGGTNNPSFPGVGPGSIQPTFASVGNPPPTDAFVTKVNPSGTAFVYSTYLGAADLDGGSGIAVDSSGAAYVLGITRSTSGIPGIGPGSLQPNYGGGATDAFVAKLNPAGSALVYASYLGSTGTEVPGTGGSIDVDSAGRAFVTGITNGLSTFPGGSSATIVPANGGTLGTFVTELAPNGASTVFTAVLGGTGGGNNPGAVALNPAGNPYVTGATMSSSFTGVGQGSLQQTKGAGQDGFVAKIVATTQAIAFTSTPPSPAAVGGSYAVTTTGGGSGNPVVLSIDPTSTAGSCSLAGSTVHFDHVGTCILDANQAGNGDYPPAPQVQQTMVVVKGTPVLAWPQPAQIAFGTPLGATQLDPTASVPGTFDFDPPAGTVLQPGTHTLSATFTPASTADYETASVTTQLVVEFTAPCITSTRTGPLKVTAGQSLCMTGVLSGPVTVEPGGALWASGARFTGPLTASDAAALTLCGSTLTGPLTISGTTGPVVVGDPPVCAPNTITGPVRIVRNLGGVTFDGNRVIGSVTIANNNGGIDATGNVVTGPVALSANSSGTCLAIGNAFTCTFTETGSDVFNVPPSVTNASFSVVGAQGGTYTSPVTGPHPGGAGGRAVATLPVVPGQVLQVDVAGKGGTGNPTSPTGGMNNGPSGGTGGAGGFGGSDNGVPGAPGDASGGAGGSNPFNGGNGSGGGGSSDVRTRASGCASLSCSLSTRVVVAAGGGGVGGNGGRGNALGGSGGAAGGAIGANGVNGGGGNPGQAGTGAGPGAAGSGGINASSGRNGTNGSSGSGGAGGNGNGAGGAAGGGGGGGWFGGGGASGGGTGGGPGGGENGGSGGAGGGGGGGSSFVASSATAAALTPGVNDGAVNGGNGQVTVTWTAP